MTASIAECNSRDGEDGDMTFSDFTIHHGIRYTIRHEGFGICYLCKEFKDIRIGTYDECLQVLRRITK
jgi:hypothetical protein